MEIEIKKGIFYNPDGHDYYEKMNQDRRRIPSVTEVINSFDVDKAKRFYTEESRIRGTIIHKTCFLDDEGTLDESTVEKWLKPYLDAYRKWKKEHQPVILNHEYSVYDETLDICGTVDICALLPLSDNPKRRNYIDIKSGVKSASHILQLSGYCIIEEGPKWLSSGSYCLYLDNKGRYNFQEHRVDKRMVAGAEWVRMVKAFQDKRSQLFWGE